MIPKKNLKEIAGLFLIWRIYLIILLLVALNYVPLRFEDKFLGGGAVNYQNFPLLFPWANFDGEHYLLIATTGYEGSEQAFFPVYPLLISLLSQPFSIDSFSALMSSTIAGLIISNLFFLASLIMLWKLVRLDYGESTAKWTLLLLILFPTSFYFVSLYNESLFLFLSVASFHSARRGNWWLAGILGAVASGTRIFGILLLPVLFIEAWQAKASFRQVLGLLLIPLGLLIYMYYLWVSKGDPIAFFHLQAVVGEQRTSGFTLLPQTFFRYLKMFFTANPTDPIYQTIVLEFFTGILFLVLPVYGYFKKMRLSYLIYAFLGYLIASAQGSLSSVPRYILVLFPSFILMGQYLENRPFLVKLGLALFFVVWLSIETILFLRGYWIA